MHQRTIILHITKMASLHIFSPYIYIDQQQGLKWLIKKFPSIYYYMQKQKINIKAPPKLLINFTHEKIKNIQSIKYSIQKSTDILIKISNIYLIFLQFKNYFKEFKNLLCDIDLKIRNIIRENKLDYRRRQIEVIKQLMCTHNKPL